MLQVVIMAAGASRRFEGCKLLAGIDGIPMLQRTALLARELVEHPSQIQVITGAWHQEIQRAQDEGEIMDLPLLYNAQWDRGLGCSIAFAVNNLPSNTERLLILLADQVEVKKAELTAFLNLPDDTDIKCAFYAGKRGVPAVFSKNIFPKLAELDGDQGAKSLLYDEQLKVVELAMDSAERDIDRRCDL